MTTLRGKCNACCVPGCNSNSTPSFRNRGGRITTFKLPRDETRRKDWIQAIPKRKYPPTVNHNVCILHFNEEDFSRNNRRIDLKKNAIPSIFPFVDGQSYDESTDICDEVWIEYVGYKKNSLKNALEDVDNKIPTQTSDISRNLIERLRIPGSKYFGIDTSEITIETDSDFESESCEPKATTKTTKSSRRKRKVNKSEREANTSTDEFNVDAIDMTDPQSYLEESSDSVQGNRIPIIDSENANTVDSEDTFGAMVSSKLQLMSPLQRLMAQKIISEILLKGQLGMLKSSLSPVLVAGYMRGKSVGVTKRTTNVIASSDCFLPMCDDDSNYSNDIDNASEDCDPLMFQVKKSKIRGTKSECFDFVKDEIVSSDDDPA